MWAIVQDNEVEEIITRPRTIVVNDITHPANIFSLWSEQELNAIGVYSVEEDDTEVPPLHTKGQSTYEFDGEKVIETANFDSYDLAVAKEYVRDEVNKWKDSMQESDFTFDNNPFQCDLVSRTLITGAALDAVIAKQNNDEFSITWVDSENGLHVFDADEMIALGKAAKAHVESFHEQALIKKAQIEMAEDIQTLVSILESLQS